MSKAQSHALDPAIVKRLGRASGHLSSVIAMIEQEQRCLNIAPARQVQTHHTLSLSAA